MLLPWFVLTSFHKTQSQVKFKGQGSRGKEGKRERGKERGNAPVTITHRPKRRFDSRDVVEERRGQCDAAVVDGHGEGDARPGPVCFCAQDDLETELTGVYKE